jgi:hypothetical protein
MLNPMQYVNPDQMFFLIRDPFFIWLWFLLVVLIVYELCLNDVRR